MPRTLEYEPVEIVPPRRVELLAVASLVLGVLGLTGSVVATISLDRPVAIGVTVFVMSFCGLATGGFAGDRIESCPKKRRGEWMALGGIILNILALVYAVGFFAVASVRHL